MPKKKKGNGHNQANSSGKKKDRAVKRALRRERKLKASRQKLTDEEFVSFDNQLQAQGLTLKDVPGDGNCLFRALSDQLDGGSTKHQEIRQQVIQYMKENREDFEPFLDEEEPFDEYLSELAKDGTYGDNDSIVAFARCFGVDVVIHQLNAPCLEVLCVDRPLAMARPRALHIAYLYGEHYSSVRPYGASKGSGPLSMPQAKSCEKNISRENSCKEKKDAKTLVCNTSSNNDEEIDDLELQELLAVTGCKDITLARDCLIDAGYDVTLAVPQVLQLMDMFCEDLHTDNDRTGGHPNSRETVIAEPHPQAKTKLKQPKQLASSQHVSNKKRKEAAKRERKKRHIEEKRQKSQEEPTVPEISITMGSLAI